MKNLKNKGKPLTSLKQGLVYFERMAVTTMQKTHVMEGKSRMAGKGLRQLLPVDQQREHVSSDTLD